MATIFGSNLDEEWLFYDGPDTLTIEPNGGNDIVYDFFSDDSVVLKGFVNLDSFADLEPFLYTDPRSGTTLDVSAAEGTLPGAQTLTFANIPVGAGGSPMTLRPNTFAFEPVEDPDFVPLPPDPDYVPLTPGTRPDYDPLYDPSLPPPLQLPPPLTDEGTGQHPVDDSDLAEWY